MVSRDLANAVLTAIVAFVVVLLIAPDSTAWSGLFVPAVAATAGFLAALAGSKARRGNDR